MVDRAEVSWRSRRHRATVSMPTVKAADDASVSSTLPVLAG
jgi:hypothetical protein